jgi:hypothetical protein
MKRGRIAFTLAVVGVVLALAANRAAGQGQNVRLVGHIGTPGNACGVYVTGGLAYIADEQRWNGTRSVGHFQIVDVSNPTAPQLRGSYDTPGWAWGVYVTGGLAYVADGVRWITPEDQVGSFQIIDVSNPAAPTLRGSCDVPGNVYDVYVTGGLAYVANFGIGLQIIDVSNPSWPTLRGSYARGGASDVYVTGGLAFVTDIYSGLTIIDVSNATSPTLRGTYHTPGAARGIYVTGGLAYVACGWWTNPVFAGSLQIIEVSNPTSPTLRGSYDPGYCAVGVYVTGGLAYVATKGIGLQIIDVSNPSAPQLRGSYDTTDACGVYVTGGLAYVADYFDGLWIFQFVGEAPRLQSAILVDVNNNRLTDAGDKLVLTLDRGVIVNTSVLRAGHFFLPVAGDSLGTTGLRVGVNRLNSRQIILTLGQGAHLTGHGTFSMQHRTAGSPSGIDFAASLPFGAIKSLGGISTIDGGVLGVDDSAVDVQLLSEKRTPVGQWRLYR